jgi:L-amino acid N-acyltransferase YncA
MDGTTWRRYRLIVERGGEPPFFLDLDHPDDWPDHFRATGFTTIAEYFSALVDDIAIVDPRVAAVTKRMQANGVRIRSLDQGRIEAELRAIHGLSLAAFRNAFLYSPIDEAAFMALYGPLFPRIDPRLVLVAEHDGRLAGYVFAAPDLNETSRGARMRTLVVKTIAVRPERVYGGLGAVLLAEVQHNALALGLDRAVHAMMHVSNASRALSAHWHARQIRRYELFARNLA